MLRMMTAEAPAEANTFGVIQRAWAIIMRSMMATAGLGDHHAEHDGYFSVGVALHQFARVDAVTFITGPKTIGARPNVATFFSSAAIPEAMPEFCRPTSSEIVRQVSSLIPRARHTK